MVEFFVLATLAVVGLAVAAVLGFVFFLIKLVFWLVFLPVKLVFWGLFFPLKFLLKLILLPIGLTFGALGAGGTIGLPIVVVFFGGFLLFALATAIIGLLIPIVPFVLLGLLLWTIFGRGPVAA